MTGRGKLLAALSMSLAPLMMMPTTSQAQIFIGVSVRIGPPPLPVYVQPPIPAPNHIWAPGYWAWDDWWGDYYWVPGTWVLAPRPGLLWTPGWWGWNDGAYAWHGGYWGPHVGWYGGISYGFGYTGSGYYGGEWRGGNFYYNRSVTNIGNGPVTNVFNRTVVNNTTIINNHNVSYSGGPGGVTARPTREQLMALNEPHIAATPQQIAHNQAAQANRAAFTSVNRGRPPVLAQARPLPAPVGPIHPPGMARPAPGGGLPGAGVRAAPRSVQRGEETAGMPHATNVAARPDTVGMPRRADHQADPDVGGVPHGAAHADMAGMRSDRSDGMNDGMRERDDVAPRAPHMERVAHQPSPVDPTGGGMDGMSRARMEDRAPPSQMEHPHVDAPRPPHPPAPPHRPPPEHHAAPHEGGGGHNGHPGGEGEHHHD